mgnify:CR=1 FL=1
MREEVTKRSIGTQKSDAERATEKFPLLQFPPYETVQAFCELLGDELDYRSARGLDVQDLRRYYRNLFLTDGSTLSPLGVYGYASRLDPGAHGRAGENGQ